MIDEKETCDDDAVTNAHGQSQTNEMDCDLGRGKKSPFIPTLTLPLLEKAAMGLERLGILYGKEHTYLSE
jgi:hypothetical protein